MIERHRQQQFKSSFDLELDLEKALWVPGRKKIFIPAPKPKYTWSFDDLFKPSHEQEAFFKRIAEGCWNVRLYDASIRIPVNHEDIDCAPGRSTWLGVMRSSESNFRPRRFVAGI